MTGRSVAMPWDPAGAVAVRGGERVTGGDGRRVNCCAERGLGGAVPRMALSAPRGRLGRGLLEGERHPSKEPIMYEMCAGPERPGGVLVWHVMVKQSTTTLCGQRLVETVDAAGAQRAGHCSACMASFAKLMTAPPEAGPSAVATH
ncbi:hypothetical protein GCM10010448_21900 [Streptomyces glomeratus]|uniref:Uncharacterized protein n=2 Tax=Streptomyces glomeratus TaxID=284452 RepID=A0ABP6LFH4_9ACTN